MGRFVVRKTSTGFVFDLLAVNGQVVATSQVYSAEKSCRKGVRSVAASAPAAGFTDLTAEPVILAPNPKFEMYKDKAGEFRFRLKARNGQVIAVSEGYKEKSGCQNGIESVKKNAVDPKVEKKD